MIEATCPICSARFKPRAEGKPQRYCSKACYSAAATVRRRTNRVPKMGPCVVCGTPTRQFNGVALCGPRCRKVRNNAKQTEYRAKRPEVHRKAVRDYYHRNPERWDEYRLRRRVAYRTPPGVCTDALIRQRFDYYANRCWMCGAPATEKDHVKPISAGGPHLPANIRPACSPCNKRKADRWPVSTATRIDQRIQVVQVH